MGVLEIGSVIGGKEIANATCKLSSEKWLLLQKIEGNQIMRVKCLTKPKIMFTTTFCVGCGKILSREVKAFQKAENEIASCEICHKTKPWNF